MSLSATEQPATDLALRNEMQRYTRYLVGMPASSYQEERYLDFHRKRAPHASNSFDALLHRISRLGLIGLILADAYSGTLYRTCLLRIKLMLALGILECSAPTFQLIDTPSPGGSWVFVTLAVRVARAAVALALASVFLVPLHVLYAAAGGTRRSMKAPA